MSSAARNNSDMDMSDEEELMECLEESFVDLEPSEEGEGEDVHSSSKRRSLKRALGDSMAVNLSCMSVTSPTTSGLNGLSTSTTSSSQNSFCSAISPQKEVTPTPAPEISPGSEALSSSGVGSSKTVCVFGRNLQHKVLKAALKSLPGTLFLWGAPSSGKTFTVEKILEETGIHKIKIHSAEIICGRRAFYETLVKQLVSRNQMVLSPDYKCDSLRTLYHNFFTYFSQRENRSAPVVIIVKGAENLRGDNEDILHFFTTFQAVTQARICVVLISTLPPDSFLPTVLDHKIIPVYFPQYSLDELTQILIQQNKNVRGKSVKGSACFEFYIKMIVNMFYYVCRDVRKLQRLAISHWETFQRMVDESQDVNLTRLWKKLEPQLKIQFFQMNTTVSIGIKNSNSTTDNNISMSKQVEHLGSSLELPLNAKYLLIASYLATHNPPSSDKRFFVKGRTAGKSKSRKTVSKADSSSDKQTSTRSFELNRLNAIFGSIQAYCDEKTVNKNRNISFMTLLSSLCQNKFIQHLGEDSTGNQKYRCLLDYDTVLDLSRSVNFELNNYLYRLL